MLFTSWASHPGPPWASHKWVCWSWVWSPCLESLFLDNEPVGVRKEQKPLSEKSPFPFPVSASCITLPSPVPVACWYRLSHVGHSYSPGGCQGGHALLDIPTLWGQAPGLVVICILTYVPGFSCFGWFLRFKEAELSLLPWNWSLVCLGKLPLVVCGANGRRLVVDVGSPPGPGTSLNPSNYLCHLHCIIILQQMAVKCVVSFPSSSSLPPTPPKKISTRWQSSDW